MDILNVIRNVNISTLFFAPILKSIADNISYKYSTTKFHLLPLLYEYGLINTYLYSYNSTDKHSLFLLFDQKEVLKKMIKTNHPDQTLNNLLLSHPYFLQVFNFDGKLLYQFSLPSEFDGDYQLIRQGKYSQVSKEFKKIVMVSGFVLKPDLLKSKLAYFIVKQNLAHGILEKEDRVNVLLEESLKCPIPKENEYFSKFKLLKEYFSIKKLNDFSNGKSSSSDFQTVIHG